MNWVNFHSGRGHSESTINIVVAITVTVHIKCNVIFVRMVDMVIVVLLSVCSSGSMVGAGNAMVCCLCLSVRSAD